MNLPFRTKKLGKYIKRVSAKARDVKLSSGNITVYGVTNKEGIVVTGKDSSDDLSNYIVVGENTFAYNPYRVNVGSLGLSPKGFMGVVSPAYVVFKIKDSLLPDFLFNYLKSDVGINLIKWYGDKGGVRSALRYKDLEKIDIPDLDVKQQEKFLGKLKKINEALAVMHERGTKIREHVNLLRQAILQEAVQGKLVEQDPKDEPVAELLKKIKAEKDRLIKEKKIKKEKPLPAITKDEIPFELPKGWICLWLNEIAFVTKLAGFEYSKYINLKEEGDIPALRAQNIKMNRIDENSLLYIDKKTSDILGRSALTKKAILMTFIGAGIGDVAIFEKKTRYHLAPNVAKIELFVEDQSIMHKYVLYYLMSKLGRNEIFKFSKATAQPSLSMGTIRQIRVLLPSETEQKRIVEKVDKLMKYCDELEVKIKQSKSDSEKLMQAVLQEAFEN